MASVTKLMTNGRNGWRVRFYVDKKRRELYLAGATKRIADSVGRFCDELAHARASNVAASGDAVTWAAGTDGKMRESLVAWGLTEPINPRLATDAGRLLGAYCAAYIAGRTDAMPRTIINYKQAHRLLVEYFGVNKPMRSITATDADRWRRWMLNRPLAIATVS